MKGKVRNPKSEIRDPKSEILTRKSQNQKGNRGIFGMGGNSGALNLQEILSMGISTD